MLSARSWARNWRLLDRARKTPMIRKDRQMMVIEKKLRTRYCHRLFRDSLRK